MSRQYRSEQERNLTILTRAVWWLLLGSFSFGAWWLYQGVGFFKDEMSFQDVYGARHGLKMPLPAGTVPDRGQGFDAADLYPAAVVAGLAGQPRPDLALGAKLYHDNCVFCHAADGAGDAPVGLEYDPRPPDLNVAMRQMTDAEAFAKVSDGILSVPGIDTFPPLGPDWHAFRLYLDESERRQIVDYLRQRFGSGPLATPPSSSAISRPEYHIVGNPPQPRRPNK